MAESGEIKEFPDVKGKLAAPKKQSAFEKDRLAAQAKRRRAEEETAAALREFQNDHGAGEDHDDDYNEATPLASADRAPPIGPRGMGTGNYGRHVPPSPAPRSGPGSLDHAPRSSTAARARGGMLHRQNNPMKRTEDEPHDDDQGYQAPKPTISLSSLPPGTTDTNVRAILQDHLQIHSIDLTHRGGPGASSGNRSVSAIVTLVADTTASQVENTVSTLKGRYLSCGYYLSINRHLSSTAMHPSVSMNKQMTSTEPFGAETPRESQSRGSMRNAPPPMEHHGFAPPGSYDTPSRPASGMLGPTHPCVPVQPPPDIQSIRAIHTIADRMLSEPDPARAMQLEAMLMAQPKVQKNEHFAFLYDSRSLGGVYYRYLLWRPEHRTLALKGRGVEQIYSDISIDWSLEKAQVPFPDVTSLDQVVDDIHYISSDEESGDEGAVRRFNAGRGHDPDAEDAEKRHLTPVQHARLVHLLSRLPTTRHLLRKGDVARVTNFAINHAQQGAEEIVDMLLFNVSTPFSSTQAAKYEHDESDESTDRNYEYEPASTLPSLTSNAPPDDPSGAKLIALYLISDILLASPTAGVRNAWKYRQLFEAGFKSRATFQHLGRLDKMLGWGRIKSDQWKNKIKVVFEIWEENSSLATDVSKTLRADFYSPPLTEAERIAEERRLKEEEKKAQAEHLARKFKRVGSQGSPGQSTGSLSAAQPSSGQKTIPSERNVDACGEDIGDPVDGHPMRYEDQINDHPMRDEEPVDGQPKRYEAPSDGHPELYRGHFNGERVRHNDEHIEPMSDVKSTQASTQNDGASSAISASDNASGPRAPNVSQPTPSQVAAASPQGSNEKPRMRRMRAEDLI